MIKNFKREFSINNNLLVDETGAVAVEWIGMAAGTVFLGIIVVYAVFSNGMSSLASTTNENFESIYVVADIDPGQEVEAIDGDQTGDGVLDAIAVAAREPTARQARQAERQARRQAQRAARQVQRQAQRAVRQAWRQVQRAARNAR